MCVPFCTGIEEMGRPSTPVIGAERGRTVFAVALNCRASEERREKTGVREFGRNGNETHSLTIILTGA